MRAVLIGTALWPFVGCAFTQKAAPLLTFEVASVKPAAQNCGAGAPCPVMIRYEPGGGPAWINTDRFDIDAKTDSHDAADSLRADSYSEQRKTGVERTRERLRNLLADRFQLAIRREVKGQQVYALVIAKGGLNLQESKEGKGLMRMGRGMLSGQGVEPAFLATTLSGQLGRPVINKTGLTGKYDLDLKWTPDPGQGLSGPFGPPPPGAPDPPPDPNGPSLTALNEQLGLRLESEKGPAEVLVIDRVEKPSEN